MATCLSVSSTSLERLSIGSKYPQTRPGRKTRRPPPLTRTLLPVLTELHFKGVNDYLEDLVARIDAPLLKDLDITFLHQLILDTPKLTQFITRTPNFKALSEAEARTIVVFSETEVLVRLQTLEEWQLKLKLKVSCRQSDWQLSSLTQLCSSSFPQPLIPAVERLYIEDRYPRPDWQDDIEISQWLDLFRPFTAVQDLYISQEFMPRIAPALQELVGERVTEVLPSLQTLFLPETLPSGPVQESIKQFVDARLLAGHPVAVHLSRRESPSYPH